MKRTSGQLKTMAKRALLGHYGVSCGGQLVSQLAIFVMYIPYYILSYVQMVSRALHMTGGPSVLGTALITASLMTAGSILSYLLATLLTIFMAIGNMRICYRICTEGAAGLSDLLYPWKHHPFRFLGLYLLLTLFPVGASLVGMVVSVCLGGLIGGTVGFATGMTGFVLCLAVGIVLMLNYTQALFVLVEDPELQIGQCMGFSKALMRGNRWRFVKLWLSFTGIFLLGYVSLGIGFLWIAPYTCCTSVWFYLDLKGTPGVSWELEP
ncbi:MAG: DUF975 family protein [Eubacteriales bacterium]|nr:DUF975 family protein [Eubacteriales bacterium]